MTPARWQQVDRLFHSALERAPNLRAAFLADACGGDSDLKTQVELLLTSHEQAQSFMTTSAGDVAAELLAGQVELRPGQQIAHYTVTAFLGKGGMGEVYLAQDARLNRPVALKLLPAQFTVDAERVKRFEQEARAASALNHPGIVTVYEIGQSDSSHFTATEFIDGQTLRQQMGGARLRLGEALDIASQAAAALAAAHQAGIVHRDVKPENIMLRRDGLVKVLDFGLAKLTLPRTMATRGADLIARTDPGIVMGTVKYMSPEQARGEEVDSRTDLWSLGVVLYEMVTGHAPFEGETSSHVILGIIDSQQPPVARYGEAPAELERIIHKSLRKDRRERYQTADDLALDLKNLKHELDVQSRLNVSLPSDATGNETTRNDRARATSGSRGLAVSTDTSAALTPDRIKRRTRIAIAAAFLAVAGVVAFGTFLRLSNEPIDSVAVLPFANGDPETDYIADGISEDIINRLWRLPNLRVIAFNAVLPWKDKPKEPQVVGQTLKVRAVLMGRVALRGKTLVVTTELVDVRDNRRLWGEQFSRDFSDILALQDDIAVQIAEKLRLRLTEEEKEQLGRRPTESAAAAKLYMEGRYHFDMRTVEEIQRSKTFFQNAIKEDPNYAQAYAGLANAYTPSDLVFAPRPTMADAKAAAAKALEKDDTLPEAHTARARVLLFYDLDWQGAEMELQRTMRAHPRYAEAHHMYSHYLMYVGRTAESLDEAHTALALEDYDALLNVHLGWTYLYVGEYDKAIQQLKTAIDMNRNFFRAHLFLGKAYEQKQMYPEALAAYQQAQNLEGDSSKESRVMLSHLSAVSGNRTEALRDLADLKALYEQHKVSAYDVAIIYAGLGENEQALEWLNKAYEQRTGGVLMLKAEPIFAKLHGMPGYDDLLRRMKLPGA